MNKPSSLTFVTSNPKKLEQVSYHLDLPLHHRALDLPEIQSLDLDEIVVQKAKAAFEVIGTPVLVEDTSLCFHALGNLPGPLIKWFLSELKNEGLCKLLDGYTDRSARAEVRFGFFDGQKMRLFGGSMNGVVAPSPRGGRGFGWDAIFIPEGETKTWGEMSTEEQQRISMRRMALQKLETFVKEEL
jgi:non-canonical purine NTP pyrophosphatase (RdgB/HAM1 family)